MVLLGQTVKQVLLAIPTNRKICTPVLLERTRAQAGVQ